MLEYLYDLVWWIHSLTLVCASISFLTFVIPIIIESFVHKPQNLKQKYNAKWAVVTGGSSGIGRAITEKLASQGINVVIVALDNNLLHDLHKNLSQQYSQLEFRAVGVDLSDSNAINELFKVTEDIDVSLLFNNAGYINIGFFADTELERQIKNYDVNATCSIRITHHYLRQMIEKNLRGAISFTSSPAGLMPCPFSAIYGATKAFLTEFATSLACEVKADGIDVFVLHPSPVNTEFYNSDTAHKSSSLGLFRKTASAPTMVADVIFASIGNYTIVRDQGYFSVCLKLLLKVVDYNALSILFSLFAHTSAEHKKLTAERKNREGQKKQN